MCARNLHCLEGWWRGGDGGGWARVFQVKAKEWGTGQTGFSVLSFTSQVSWPLWELPFRALSWEIAVTPVQGTSVYSRLLLFTSGCTLCKRKKDLESRRGSQMNFVTLYLKRSLLHRSNVALGIFLFGMCSFSSATSSWFKSGHFGENKSLPCPEMSLDLNELEGTPIFSGYTFSSLGQGCHWI